MAKQLFQKQNGNSATSLDTTPANTIISHMKALPFEHIIGAPLMACVKAQSEAAKSTWNAIREIGFIESDNTADDTQEMATVSFLFQQNGVTRKITVPLLTIVPIPYMQIDSVDLKFRADMSASSEGEITAKYSGSVDSTAVKKSKYNISNEIDINLHATTSGMPSGLAKMLDIFANTCINVEEYTPDEYGEEIINAAKEEAERIKEQARKEVEKMVNEIKNPSGEKLYNISLSSKPSKEKIASIVGAIVSGCPMKANEDDIIKALQNTSNLTVARNLTKKEATAVEAELKKVGQEVIVKLIR